MFIDIPFKNREIEILKEKFTYNYIKHEQDPEDKKKEDDKKECTICFGELCNGEFIVCLPGCEHLYHWDCLGQWVKVKSNCPVCRKSIRIEM